MENRHTADELKEMQALPLEIKLALTKDRIRAWYSEWGGNVYVSRSGGKDSDVLGDIVKKMYPDVPQVFINTGLEWDSVRKHGLDISDEVLYPKMNFVEVVKSYGYPVISKEVAQRVCEAREKPDGESARRFTDCEHNRKYPQFSMEGYAWLLDAPFKISHRCCHVMKKNPSKNYEKLTGRKPFVGTMADESRLRKSNWIRYGCNAFESDRPISAPLSFWLESDILRYIKENNVEIADVYGNIVYEQNGYVYYTDLTGTGNLATTGIDRSGCCFCLFGAQRDTQRFLKLKQLEPKKYQFVMGGGEWKDGLWIPNKDGLGLTFVIDWLNSHNKNNMRILY